MQRWISACAALALLTAAPAGAQTPRLYPFTFDQDRLAGDPDFSFLNHPLTAADRVFVKNGHFYTAGADLKPNTADDVRVRFYGVNLAFGANFPEPADAARIAKRLRRLGVNLVRLHHMDSRQDRRPSDANGTLTDGPYPTFNDVSIERLRGFLAALAAEGIYADLNLHVGYQFRPAIDLVPELPGQSMPTQSKPLQILYPRMVELQQQYARGLIERLKLKGSAALAMIELDNETSLVQAWQWNQLESVLVGEYRNALASAWNRSLKAKYSTTAALQRAWGASTPDGVNILNGQWTLEQSHGKSGTLAAEGSDTVRFTPGAGQGWLFLKQTGFHLENGKRYAWTFEARADLPEGKSLTVPASIMRDVSPWDNAHRSNVTLTAKWQPFRIAFTAPGTIANSGRASLDVESAASAVSVRNMRLVEAGDRGLDPAETLDAQNLALPGPGDASTAPRANDYAAFLTATDRHYMDALRDTVRAATDPLVPLTGTQMGYGGLSILDSQDGLDYQDNHFYIDHYNFPGAPWDRADWRIHDSAAADSAWSSFLNMAWAREAGRPYTISEFNQPWPNTHAAELDTSLASFAAFQDWDAIMHFAYAHGRDWEDRAPNGFNINGDWTEFPLIGQAAWIFRTGAVKPGGSPIVVPVSAADRIRATAKKQSVVDWISTSSGLAKELALTHAVELGKDASTAAKAPAAASTELLFDAAAKRLRIDAPLAAGVFGTLGHDRATSGPVDFALASSTRGFATILVTSLDGAPLATSKRMLLSVPGYAVRSVPAAGNRAPDAATAQPQLLTRYPGNGDWWTLDPTNSGRPGKPSGDMSAGFGPTFIERVEAFVTLHTQAKAIAVYPLDGAGARTVALPASEVRAVAGGFEIHVNGEGEPASPWYSIVAR